MDSFPKQETNKIAAHVNKKLKFPLVVEMGAICSDAFHKASSHSLAWTHPTAERHKTIGMDPRSTQVLYNLRPIFHLFWIILSFGLHPRGLYKIYNIFLW